MQGTRRRCSSAAGRSSGNWNASQHRHGESVLTTRSWQRRASNPVTVSCSTPTASLKPARWKGTSSASNDSSISPTGTPRCSSRQNRSSVSLSATSASTQGKTTSLTMRQSSSCAGRDLEVDERRRNVQRRSRSSNAQPSPDGPGERSVRSPPWASATCLAIGRPRPVPCLSGRPRQNRSKNFSWSFWAIPAPWSVTTTTASLVRDRHVDLDRAPGLGVPDCVVNEVGQCTAHRWLVD